jgi:hypothetical protein
LCSHWNGARLRARRKHRLSYDDQVPGNTNLVGKDGCAESCWQCDAAVSLIAAVAQGAALLARAASNDTGQEQDAPEKSLKPGHLHSESHVTDPWTRYDAL